MKLVAQHGVGNDGAVDEIINKFFAFFFFNFISAYNFFL